MKYLGYRRYFLGIEVAYSLEGYLFYWTKYCNDVIQKAGLKDTKLITTTIETHLKLQTTDGVLSDLTCYCQLLEALFILPLPNRILFKDSCVKSIYCLPNFHSWGCS